MVKRRTITKPLVGQLQEVRATLMRNRHRPVVEQGARGNPDPHRAPTHPPIRSEGCEKAEKNHAIGLLRSEQRLVAGRLDRAGVFTNLPIAIGEQRNQLDEGCPAPCELQFPAAPCLSASTLRSPT